MTSEQDFPNRRLMAFDTPFGETLDASETTGTRNGYSNLLRVVSAFGVVCGHVATRAIYSSPNPADPQWLFSAYFGVYCLWSLPCFIMISGDMFAARGAPTMARWIHRIRRIALLTAISGVAFILISWLVLQDIDRIGISNAALGGDPFNHLWYMYFIVGLYALAPLLMRIPPLMPGWVFWMGLMLLFLLSAYGSFPGQPDVLKIPVGICLISYFLFGAQMRGWPPPGIMESFLWAAAFVTVGIVAGYVGTHMVDHYSIVPAFAFAGSLAGPVAAIMAMAVFRLVLLVPPPQWSARLAPATFLIYVIHPLWLLAFERLGYSTAWHGHVVAVPMLSVLVFTASAATALLIRWLKHKALAMLPVLRSFWLSFS